MYRRLALTIAMLAALLSASALASTPYETVNGAPRLAHDERHFSFYWGLWRTLSPEERAAIAAEGRGYLLSERELQWQVEDCATGQTMHADGERFWYLDDLRFDDDGTLVPLPEAPRPDYLYFSMATVSSRFLKGLGAFVKPERGEDEATAAYRERVSAAHTAWQDQVSVRGTRGRLFITAGHRVFVGAPDTTTFVHFFDYARGEPSASLRSLYERYGADRWPVYHDERAHKPHSLGMPRIWTTDAAPGGPRIREDRFEARLAWDWCEAAAPTAHFHIRAPGLPPAGPNRPGRADGIGASLPVIVE